MATSDRSAIRTFLRRFLHRIGKVLFYCKA